VLINYLTGYYLNGMRLSYCPMGKDNYFVQKFQGDRKIGTVL